MSAERSPEDTKSHRYKVWALKSENKWQAPTDNRRSSIPKPRIGRLTDTETLLLMYDYGMPLDLAIKGTCPMPDGSIASCTTTSLTSRRIDFFYDLHEEKPLRRWKLGDAVSTDLSLLGSVKGVLSSQHEQGFQIELEKTERSALGARVVQIAVDKGLMLDASGTIKSGMKWIEPTRKECHFTDREGILRQGHLVKLSQFDALINADVDNIPLVGSRIVLRGDDWHGADVISSFTSGFIVKFNVPIPEEKFLTTMRFR